MRTTLRWLGTIVAALLCVVAVGACGGDDSGAPSLSNEEREDDGGDRHGDGDGDGDVSGGNGGDRHGDGDGDVSGGNGGGGGGGGDGDVSGGNGGGGGGGGGGDGDSDAGGVPGAPINVPSIFQQLQSPGELDDVEESLEISFRLACGGEMCVVLDREKRDPGFTDCTFLGTDPPGGSLVERGETVIVITGTLPCEELGDNGDVGDSSDGDPGDSSDGDNDGEDGGNTGDSEDPNDGGGDDGGTKEEPIDDTDATTESTP